MERLDLVLGQKVILEQEMIIIFLPIKIFGNTTLLLIPGRKKQILADLLVKMQSVSALEIRDISALAMMGLIEVIFGNMIQAVIHGL